MSLIKIANLEVMIITESFLIGECYCSVKCPFINIMEDATKYYASCNFYVQPLDSQQSLSPLWDDCFKRTEQCIVDFGIGTR